MRSNVLKNYFSYFRPAIHNRMQVSRLDGGIGGGKATKQRGHLAAQSEDRGIVIRDLRKEYRLARWGIKG